MPELELRQEQSQLGINVPENEDAIELLNKMKALYKKCEARSINGYDFEKLFRYFDLFLEHEKERSFLMDRLSDLVMEYGEAWFDDCIPEWELSNIDDIDEWTRENKGYDTYKEWQQAVHTKKSKR